MGLNFLIQNHKFDDFLMKFDFHHVEVDPCVYSTKE
jgi:hypothetical protein